MGERSRRKMTGLSRSQRVAGTRGVNLQLVLSIPVRIRCKQCGVDMKGGPDPRVPGAAVLKCESCGFKVELVLEPQKAPGVAATGLQMPNYRPKPKT